VPVINKVIFKNEYYSFSGTTIKPRELTHPIMIKLLEKVNEMEENAEYNGVFVNWYYDGEEYIGWHSDDEKDLVPSTSIYSITFGASRKFKIKNKISKETTDFILDNGTLVIMGGDMQKEYQHCVPKTKKCKESRINLTIRSFIRK